MRKTSEQDNQDASLMAIDQYMREVRRLERLTEDEEARFIQWLERAKQRPGDQWLAMRAKHARERLIEGYQNTVIGLAKKQVYRCRRLTFLDLVQEGNIALARAIEDNDPAKGYPLHALVGVYVRHALSQMISEQDGEVKLEPHMQALVHKMRRTARELVGSLDRDPLPSEVAHAMRISEKKLQEVASYARRQRAVSLQYLLKEEGVEDRHELVSVFQGSEETGQAGSMGVEEAVRQAIRGLPEKQEQMFRLRYGLDGEYYSQIEVAQMFGTCYQNVQYAEQQAKKKLKKALASQYAAV
jgi:RNA polymerase primary sigma factor